MTHCGYCHTCGCQLKSVLDGEEWCSRCGQYRRYISHGWGMTEDPSPCPSEHEAAERRTNTRFFCMPGRLIGKDGQPVTDFTNTF